MRDEEVEDGDLHSRAMPTLDEQHVAELFEAVRPMLDQDAAIREWCSGASRHPSRGRIDR